MKKTVEFDYDIGDKVTLTEIKQQGHIDGLCFDSLGKMYRVVYWNDGSRYLIWLYPWEIAPATSKKADRKESGA